jgi:hypothetical protein
MKLNLAKFMNPFDQYFSILKTLIYLLPPIVFPTEEKFLMAARAAKLAGIRMGRYFPPVRLSLILEIL